MTFNCTAHRPECFRETATNSPADRWWVLVPIGFDDVDPLTYYFIVHTYPAKASVEFAFLLMARDNNTGNNAQSYDSAVTNAIVPKACRQHLSAILNHYARELIDASKPQTFFMETFSVNLPPQALIKYDILCQIFSGLGYTVTPSPTSPGKHLWIMNRQP